MKKTLLLLIVVSLVFFSCKKEAGIEQPQQLVAQKMTEMKFSSLTMTMTYNSDGSIKSIHRDQPPYVYDLEFSYTTGKVSVESFIGGKKSEGGEYTIVNGKAIARTWRAYDNFGNVVYTLNESFTYDAKGQLDKYIYNNGAYWKYKFNDQGDITSAVYYDENGAITDRTEYEYWDKPNKFPYFSDHNTWGEMFFIPRYSKHLVKIYRSYDMPANVKNYELKYDYDLNPGGYQVKTYTTELFPGSDQWSFTSQFQ